MKKKKPTVKTVQPKNATPKILKPAFSPFERKNDLFSKEKELSQSSFSKNRSLTPLSLKVKELEDANNNINISEEKKIFFPVLPSLISSSKDSVDKLFAKKVKLCFQQCDFSEKSSEVFISSKESILKELSQSLLNPSIQISDSEENYKLIFALIARHIFRSPEPIPPEWFSLSDYYWLSDEYHPKNFRHLSLIYDIAINFFQRETFNVEYAFELSADLFKLCVYLCRTIDDREQMKLSELMIVIYNSIKPLRHFFLKVIIAAMIRIIYDNEPFTALKPILTSLASIIAGFSKEPLKLKDFKNLSKKEREKVKMRLSLFYDCLLPIHRLPFLSYYSSELCMAIVQFLEKNSRFVIPLFKELISHWPRLHTKKQMIFIDEISWFVSYVEDSFLVDVVHLIVPQLMTSMKSCDVLITEKILAMWEINDFVWFTVTKPEITYPLIIPSIYEVASSYWYDDAKMYAAAVLNVLNINNKSMFVAVGSNLKKIQNNFIFKNLDSGSKWINLIQNYESSKKVKKVKIDIVSSIFVGCDAYLSKS